ncbi:hypothetical protein KFZ70_13905 [Tamlana fucoidanivorans]|uniref:Uncharacterized protein n=1 Tax=Allotamlana fucoidanivorans TaxID=2583814 RepID=A0A5C4SSD1_9FLAO|nr:hypothetical protein [Tamlana fucoidanivorans]TNJ46521.1 hypothetical protein FGF67_02520 [Tamlana fucoidanivorans]
MDGNLLMLLNKKVVKIKIGKLLNLISVLRNNFDKKLKFIASDVIEKEIRLASFLHMDIPTKEIAGMLNVLPESALKGKYQLKRSFNLIRNRTFTNFFILCKFISLKHGNCY